jgi:carbonic anhydrase
VRDLFREYADWLAIDLSFQGFESELAGLPGSYTPPAGELLLCYFNQQPAGCVALHQWKDDSSTAEMKRLYVCEKFRGHGVGKLLITHIVEIARTLGYRRLWLDSIGEKMGQAIALYQRVGFHQIGPYRFNPEPSATYWELIL